MSIRTIIALIPVAALAVASVGCGGGDATPEAKAPEGEAAAAPADEAAPADAAKPADDAAAAPADAAKPEEKKEEPAK